MKKAPVVRISFTKTDNFIIEQRNIPSSELKSRRFRIRGKILAANFVFADETKEYADQHKYTLTNYQLTIPFSL